MDDESEPKSGLKPNYLFAHTSSFIFKPFIKENGQIDETFKKQTIPVPNVSGLEVKKDYDNIVGEASTSCIQKRTFYRKDESVARLRKKAHKKFDKPLTVHSLMRAVEMDDAKTVGEYLEYDSNFVINSIDEFGWTAVMCASCAGAEKVIKLLLNHNFDLSTKDKKGSDCISLAKGRGHHRIAQLIQSKIDGLNTAQRISPGSVSLDSIPEQSESTRFFCDACKEDMLMSAKHSHLTSTVHNFNASRKTGLKTSYGISESNVGFQMLLKTGWNREKGLGPEGEGHKFPPKVMLKQDRTGLGKNKYIAKVTHNPADVQKPREERTNTMNKRLKEKKRKKDQLRDRALRLMLS